MLAAGELHVWSVRLDGMRRVWPTAGEAARAHRFRTPEVRQRYLRAHEALRTILGRLTSVRLDFAVTAAGKPYLPNAPELKFNLSRSHELALVAVALEVDVGVDVEWRRPVAEYEAIAAHFFPPSEWAALFATPPAEREREFFRRWTRLEAVLKARGTGLFGSTLELAGEWTVQELEVGEGFAAAVAAPRAGMRVMLHEFGDVQCA